MKKFILFASAVLSFGYAHAQMKVGSNPTTTNAALNLEVEASNGVKVAVDTFGKLGVGTNTPTSTFHITGGDNTSSVGGATTNILSRITNSAGGSVVQNMETGVFQYRLGINPTYTAFGGTGTMVIQGFNNGVGTDLMAYDYVNRNLIFGSVVGGTQVRNVGIGVNIPSQRLHIAGNLLASDSIFASKALGVGTSAPTNTLDVNGSVRVRTMGTTSANNDAVVFADSVGTLKKLTIAQLSALGVMTKAFVNPSSGAASGNIPCSTGYDVINYDAWDGNFAPTITLPNCGTPGQKIVVRSAATLAATISKTNTFSLGEGTWTVQTGDVYEFMYINNRWQLTASPTKEYGFCQAPNNSSATLLTPTTPKTIMVFWDGCYTGTVTLPAGGTLGDTYIINDLASLALTISTTNTTMASNLTINAGSFIRFVKTTQGWARDL